MATEAAGEGINLQCCNIMFDYEIPWNPNRLEQRMGRIHRYGQLKDCLIFNFVATNTVEGHVLQKLLDKLQEIRDALDDDAVFNLVVEILPASHVHRVFRDYYAGRMGDLDLEKELVGPKVINRYQAVCQSALEGLASKKLNLAMLVERRARARERRVVPEIIARFLKDSSRYVPMTLRLSASSPHTFVGITTPHVLRRYGEQNTWRFAPVANRYPRFSTDRETAEKANLEWVTPGHPLFESVRLHTVAGSRRSFAQGACFQSLDHDIPARMDFYHAQVVDELGDVINERLFAVGYANGKESVVREPRVLGNVQPVSNADPLPDVTPAVNVEDWLQRTVFAAFLDEVRAERIQEVDRISQHVELSVGELIQKEDEKIGRFAEMAERDEGTAGYLRQAEDRQSELIRR